MIFNALAALGTSRAEKTQTGTSHHRNLASPATSRGAGRRLTLLAAALLGTGAVAQAQLLSLNIDSAAKTYSWTGSASFQIQIGTDFFTYLGLGYNFESVSIRNTGLPTQSPTFGLNATGQNTYTLNWERPLFPGSARFGNEEKRLGVGPQAVVQILGSLSPNTDYEDNSRHSATYNVTVQGDGVDYSLPLNVAADLSQLDGKTLQFFRYESFGLNAGPSFLDAGTISVTPVPEPASVALASAVGLVGFAVWRRRNRSRS